MPAPASGDASPRARLVICRADSRSLHRRWLGHPDSRSYDVWIDSFEGDPGRWRGDAARVLAGPAVPKWPALARLIEEHPGVLARRAVFLPDDDLLMDPGAVERVFDAHERLGVALAQPALGGGSHWSFGWTLGCSTTYARYTNCVEAMAPVFTGAALRACLPTFGQVRSAWGLDSVWHQILGGGHRSLAVVDAVTVIHTRPVGAGGWKEPRDERLAQKRRMHAAYGVETPLTFRTYAAIPRAAGPDPSCAVPAGPGLAWLLARGAPPEVRWSRRFWSRQLRTVAAGWVAGRETGR